MTAAKPVTARWFSSVSGRWSARSFETYETTSGIVSAIPSTTSPNAISTRTRVREDPQPALPVPPGVVEQDLGDAAEEERLAAHGQHRDAEELRVEGEGDRAEIEIAETQGQRQQEPDGDQGDPRLEDEEV